MIDGVTGTGAPMTTTTHGAMESHATSHAATMKAMTLPDILASLHQEFLDEVHGANQYLDEAWAADEMHYYDLEKGLFEMGKDEYTHARFIHHCLEKHDLALTDEERTAWDALETRIQKTFR